MKTETKIIIIGTSHQLQCGTKKHTSEQIEEFKSFIKDLCLSKNIKSIIEEMSDEGLANHGVKKTVPSIIASELSIKYRDVDLSQEQREILKISEGEIVTYSRNISIKEQVNDTRSLLTNKLVDPIRERYWLSRILRLNAWPTLFICGSDHAENMQNLINSIGQGPILSWYKICPEEIDCQS